VAAVPAEESARRLPDDLRLGPAYLTVTDLDRSVAFYGEVIGLRVDRREDGMVALGSGDGREVLVLVEFPATRPPVRDAGLYHVALLYPSRLELARALQRIAVARTPIDGASDHGTHEAIYLPDPDGNGLELAADRPRERWPQGLGYNRGPARATSTGCASSSPARSRGGGPSRASRSGTCTSTSATLSRGSPSIATRSGSSSWRGCLAPPSCRRAAITITSASTSGAGGACRRCPPSADDVAAVVERVRGAGYGAERERSGSSCATRGTSRCS